uniref:Uncharacterized protein n=1 Tax=Magallana gigas TaxID=29159 RepID=K1PN33_MAGGI
MVVYGSFSGLERGSGPVKIWHYLNPKYHLMPNTIWCVVLKTVRNLASFTAIIVTNKCVNNAEMNIRRIRQPRITKWSIINNESSNFLWRNARFTPQKTLIFSVRNAKFPFVTNAQLQKNIAVTCLLI